MTAEQLQAARVAHWRQDQSPVLTLDDAQTWFERHSLSLFLPRRAQLPAPAPSFVEACLGETNPTPPRASIEQATELLVRLMATGKVVGLNLLGGIGEQPDFVATTEILPFVVALRGDREWKQAPQKSGGHKVSPLVAEVWKTLEQKGALSAGAVRESLGRELTEAAVLRALSELWQDLRTIPVVQPGAEPAVWELLQLHHRQELTSGISMSQVTALSLLVSMYLQSVYAASSEEIETFLSPLASRSRIREAVRGLSATRQIHSLSMDAQTYYFLEGGLPEFEAIPEVRETRVPQPDAGNGGAMGIARPPQTEHSERPVRKGPPPFAPPADRAAFPAAAQGGSAALPPQREIAKRRPAADSRVRSGARPFRNRPDDRAEQQARGPADRRSSGDWKQRAGERPGRGPRPPESGPQERWRKFPQKPERQDKRPFQSQPQRREDRPAAGYGRPAESASQPKRFGKGSAPGGGRHRAEFGRGAVPGSRPSSGPRSEWGKRSREERTPRQEGAQEGGGFRPPARRFPPRGDQRQTRGPKWRRPGEERGTGSGRDRGVFAPRKEGAFAPGGLKPRGARPTRPARPEGTRPEGERSEAERRRFAQGKPANARSKFPPKFPAKFPTKFSSGAGERNRPPSASGAGPGGPGKKNFGNTRLSGGRFGGKAEGKLGRPASANPGGKPRGFDPRPPSSGNREGGKPGFRGRKFGKKRPEA